MCFYYLRVPESGFRTVTSRPELIPSVTLPREEGEGNRLEKVARHPTSRPLLGAKCWLSGPTVGTNHGKATKKHKKLVWYWHLQNMS